MNTETQQELILKVESKIITANTADWEAEQKAFLSGLTAKFETDEDFANAETELKEIEARENAAKTALDAVVNGSQDVSALIDNVSAVIEDLRQARLSHSKIIKAEKESRKQAIIDKPIDELRKTYSLDTPVTPALKIRLPLSDLETRLHNAAKKKRSIDGITKGINAESTAIKAEMMSVVNQLNERLALIPADKKHLFADVDKLIAGDDDLQPIIDGRIKADDERQAAEKARIEAEAKAKAERQAAEAQAGTTEQETVKPEPLSAGVVGQAQPITESQQQPDQQPITEPTAEPVNDTYTVYVNDVTMHVYGDIEDVKAIAKCLKDKFETVRLVKGSVK